MSTEDKTVDMLNESFGRHATARTFIGMGAYGVILSFVCYSLPQNASLACLVGSVGILLWGLYETIMAKRNITKALK